jgi:Putative metal-binding motif
MTLMTGARALVLLTVCASGLAAASPPPTRITNDPATSREADICSHPDSSDLSIVWVDFRTGSGDVYLTRVDALGATLTGAIRVSSSSRTAVAPNCSVDSSGNTYIVWEEDDYFLYAKYDSAGSVSRAAFAREGQGIQYPRIAVEDDGTAHVTWVDVFISRSVLYRKLDANGDYVAGCPAITVFTDSLSTSVTELPSITAPTPGDASHRVSWHRHPFFGSHYIDKAEATGCASAMSGVTQDGGFDVLHSEMRSDRARSGSTLVYDGNLGGWHAFLLGVSGRIALDQGAGPVLEPDIAGRNDQDLFAVWQDGRHGTSAVYGRAVDGDAKAPVGGECLISNPASNATLPAIARASASQFGVVWSDDKDGQSEIYYSAQTSDCNEVCNDVDDDGDGDVDEGCDDDLDGYCDEDQIVVGLPAVCSLGIGDCDDGDAAQFPGNPESCDLRDNDCNGSVDDKDEDIDGEIDDGDGDGLLDCWEEVGMDVNDDEMVDLELNSSPFNADPDTKDIFVEMDYMKVLLHSHKPPGAVLRRVTDAFWNSKEKIRLHLMVDEDVPHVDEVIMGGIGGGVLDDIYDFMFGSPPQDPCNTDAHFGTQADRDDLANCANRMVARRLVFRYVLWAHRIYASSGVLMGLAEEWPVAGYGSDKLVIADSRVFWRAVRDISMRWGSWPLSERIDGTAGIFMHELGHTLGLLHGGGTEVHCKPNYISVMNYTRDFNDGGEACLPGEPHREEVRTNRALDYSSGWDPVYALDEAILTESVGVGGPSSQRVVYGNAAGETLIGPAAGPIDWNCDEDYGDVVSSDVNQVGTEHDCDGSNGAELMLEGYDDWANLRYRFCPSGPAPEIPEYCLAAPEAVALIDEGTEPNLADYLDGVLGDADADGDGVANVLDLCPVDADPGQIDGDGDGYGDLCDCDAADGNLWDDASDVASLSFLDAETLEWDEPLYFGASTVIYDVLRASDPSAFNTAIVCVEEGDGADAQATDLELPNLGRVFHYLTRARNDCPGSIGILGLDSQGNNRVGQGCP